MILFILGLITGLSCGGFIMWWDETHMKKAYYREINDFVLHCDAQIENHKKLKMEKTQNEIK